MKETKKYKKIENRFEKNKIEVNYNTGFGRKPARDKVNKGRLVT